MVDQGAQGDPGRKGDTGRVGDSGRTGDTGDTGRGLRGYSGEQGIAGATGDTGAQGAKGEPGVTSTLTITQLDAYVKRLESRYRRVSRLLIAGLITIAAVFAVAGLTTVDQFGQRVDGQQTNRRAAIMELCVARNERGEELLAFLKEVAPENLELARESFPATNCADTVQRLAPSR